MTLSDRTLAVSAIRSGTVIDHIQAGSGMKIVNILSLCSHRKPVSLGLNLASTRLGLKDLIKIEGRALTKAEANQVAIFAPDATINIIAEYKVSEKFKVALPESLENLIACPNPRCVSNHETVPQIVKVLHRTRETIRLECHYCRKSFTQEEIK